MCVFAKKSSYLIARNLSRIHLLFNISGVESFSLKIEIIIITIITIIIMIIMIRLIQVLIGHLSLKGFQSVFHDRTSKMY